MNALFVLVCNLFFVNQARADLIPPPKCPEGTYSTYAMGYRCVQNGYDIIIASDYDISKEDIEKIKNGTITVDGLDPAMLSYDEGIIQIKEEMREKIIELFEKRKKQKEEKQNQQEGYSSESNKKENTEATPTKVQISTMTSNSEEKSKNTNTSNTACSHLSIKTGFLSIILVMMAVSFRRKNRITCDTKYMRQ